MDRGLCLWRQFCDLYKSTLYINASVITQRISSYTPEPLDRGSMGVKGHYHSVKGESLPNRTVCYNWPMSAHVSQAFSIARSTHSEDLPKGGP